MRGTTLLTPLQEIAASSDLSDLSDLSDRPTPALHVRRMLHLIKNKLGFTLRGLGSGYSRAHLLNGKGVDDMETNENVTFDEDIVELEEELNLTK